MEITKWKERLKRQQRTRRHRRQWDSATSSTLQSSFSTSTFCTSLWAILSGISSRLWQDPYEILMGSLWDPFGDSFNMILRDLVGISETFAKVFDGILLRWFEGFYRDYLRIVNRVDHLIVRSCFTMRLAILEWITKVSNPFSSVKDSFKILAERLNFTKDVNFTWKQQQQRQPNNNNQTTPIENSNQLFNQVNQFNSISSWLVPELWLSVEDAESDLLRYLRLFFPTDFTSCKKKEKRKKFEKCCAKICKWERNESTWNPETNHVKIC